MTVELTPNEVTLLVDILNLVRQTDDVVALLKKIEVSK